MTKHIELEVKSWSSPDVDLSTWIPAARKDVHFLLELEIGERKDNRADLFQIMVATPEGLRAHAQGLIISERSYFVVSDYSWDELKRGIEQIVTRCASPSWDESVLKLQRYFRWEYEDYVTER